MTIFFFSVVMGFATHCALRAGRRGIGLGAIAAAALLPTSVWAKQVLEPGYDTGFVAGLVVGFFGAAVMAAIAPDRIRNAFLLDD